MCQESLWCNKRLLFLPSLSFITPTACSFVCCLQLPVSVAEAISSVDAARKASDWVKVAQSRLKTPVKSTDDTLPPDDSAKKIRRKFVKYFFSYILTFLT